LFTIPIKMIPLIFTRFGADALLLDNAATVATISMSDPIQLEEALRRSRASAGGATRVLSGPGLRRGAQMRQRSKPAWGRAWMIASPWSKPPHLRLGHGWSDRSHSMRRVLARRKWWAKLSAITHWSKKLGEAGLAQLCGGKSEPVQRRVAFKSPNWAWIPRKSWPLQEGTAGAGGHGSSGHCQNARCRGDGKRTALLCHGVGQRDQDHRLCDQHKLSHAQTAGAFIRVCRAVEHAQPKGHHPPRYQAFQLLSPMHDGKPAPKVIDFGIAKATQGSLADKADFTAADHSSARRPT